MRVSKPALFLSYSLDFHLDGDFILQRNLVREIRLLVSLLVEIKLSVKRRFFLGGNALVQPVRLEFTRFHVVGHTDVEDIAHSVC